ncbi:MAG: YybH family protein [Solirubrobacterales bacterium]
MRHPTAESTIDVPIDGLPPIDEHSVAIAADPGRTWEALIATLPRALGSRRGGLGASMLGSAYTEAKGEPSVIGSTLPGFVVSRSVRPATLALLGQHRFSRYALVFCIDDLGPGRSRLRAETRAEFPGATGRVYRGLVIGTRGHVLVVRRLLRAVRKRAENATAKVDRTQIAAWVAAYERAWRSEGTDSLAALFAPDASYSTGPYERSHLGLEAIAEMWEAERRGHDEVFEMHSEIVTVEGDTGVVRVAVHYEEPRAQEYRDLWILRLDEQGRCFHFEEWPFWPAGSDGNPAAGAEA